MELFFHHKGTLQRRQIQYQVPFTSLTRLKQNLGSIAAPSILIVFVSPPDFEPKKRKLAHGAISQTRRQEHFYLKSMASIGTNLWTADYINPLRLQGSIHPFRFLRQRCFRPGPRCKSFLGIVTKELAVELNKIRIRFKYLLH